MNEKTAHTSSQTTQPSNDNDEQFSLPYAISRAWERNNHGARGQRGSCPEFHHPQRATLRSVQVFRWCTERRFQRELIWTGNGKRWSFRLRGVVSVALQWLCQGSCFSVYRRQDTGGFALAETIQAGRLQASGAVGRDCICKTAVIFAPVKKIAPTTKFLTELYDETGPEYLQRYVAFHTAYKINQGLDNAADRLQVNDALNKESGFGAAVASRLMDMLYSSSFQQHPAKMEEFDLHRARNMADTGEILLDDKK
jgi:hypothetical protein